MRKHIRRPSPAMALSVVALFVALGGTSYAAAKINGNDIKKGTVAGSKLKNKAVTSAKIKNGAVTATKLKNGAVTAAKIKNGAITGAKLNLGTLGTVPSAVRADSAGAATTAETANVASSLAGQISFYKRLNLGESAVIATNGPVSVSAVCSDASGDDRIGLVAATTVGGAAMNGDDYDYDGSPGNALEPGTPLDQRYISDLYSTGGQTYVSSDIDEGFVMAPSGEIVSLNTEGTVFGLNYAGAKCFVAGVANTFNP